MPEKPKIGLSEHLREYFAACDAACKLPADFTQTTVQAMLKAESEIKERDKLASVRQEFLRTLASKIIKEKKPT